MRLFASLYEKWPADPTQPRSRAVIWNVTRNRKADPAIEKSVKAMKADAGRMLFSIDCSALRCAVIDSGIDTLHPAFQNREPRSGEPRSRVIGTYDFGDLRYALDPRFLEKLRDLVRTGTQPPSETSPKREDRALARTHRRFSGYDAPGTAQIREDRLADYLQLVIDRANAGLEIDWAVVEPLIHEPLTDTVAPPPPRLPHGTQVAGVLAADHPQADGSRLAGVCPDLRLYDLRVVSETEDNATTVAAHDFEVIAALKFLGHLNGRADEPAVHAANVSVSIPHDVSRFACGRTPICEECERLVSSGVAVVAAAGNSGYNDDEDVDARFYRSGSITDPGNAELVLTVGSTHREMPHQYGVSYFSSRGPTGDGRRKPDLVAPGEKLSVPAPGGRLDIVDGTSFAAPHVTGAALLMMARHTELIGRPQRIKEVLCSSATDLGREPYSQGAGMLDVLRALQSI